MGVIRLNGQRCVRGGWKLRLVSHLSAYGASHTNGSRTVNNVLTVLNTLLKKAVQWRGTGGKA
jgi:hypothetical protein